MTEAEQIKALQAENDRIRAELDLMNDTLTGNLKQIAELEAIRARVPSDGMIDAAAFVDSTNEIQATGFHLGARWMRDRIFPPENKEK